MHPRSQHEERSIERNPLDAAEYRLRRPTRSQEANAEEKVGLLRSE
jgi:hypothetical protein